MFFGRHKWQGVERLSEYVFIDRARLRSYLEQVGDGKRAASPSWQVGLSVAGPTIAATQGPEREALSDHEAIRKLLQFLIDKKLVDLGRPVDRDNPRAGRDFALEQMQAWRMVFPVPDSSRLRGLRQIIVWFSPPSPETVTGSGYGEGTFLYLIESHWESDERYGGPVSGLTALWFVVEDLVKGGAVSDAVLGRYFGPPARVNTIPPMELFRQMGACIQEPRQIRSLYRKRYLSDIQCFADKDGRHRSFDLVGYPVYVEAM